MTRRLILGYLAVTVVVLLVLEVPLAVFFAQRERERFSADVERDARVIATIYEDALEKGLAPDPRPAATYHGRTGARVVVVGRDGISVVDTDSSVGRDFSTRPEIAAALTGERAAGTRASETLGTDLLYVAVPVASGGAVYGALRVTLGTGSVDARIHRFWFGLGLIAVVVLALMSLVGWLIARSVTRPLRRLGVVADRFAAGDLGTSTGTVGGPPEIRTLDRQMSTMAERLAELLAEQRAFVADASHQLRTPLTALRLRLENLAARADEGDATAAELDAAIDETDRLARLVTDLLQLARAEQAGTAVVTDVAALATDRVDTWTAVAEAAGVRIVLEGADGPVQAMAVPGAVEQVLDNVLDNAISVAPVGSTVAVVLERRDSTCTLAVVDHGPGLSDEDKARAVRRFWRGGSATPGTGLGLPIAESLARACGGTLTLADTPGGGLTVTLELPAAP